MQIFNNYRTVFDRGVSDINSRALMLRHEKTGARIFVLSNDDDNKVFYIGFRTPPADSSGMPHIIEHSVLCGSEKYPVKDPFVELCKSSLNTFLNAMTYGDKTLYPCASRNDADFKNLMDVYLDAVFHPAILKQPLIYKQEGWSYKLESPEDDLEYNGVVYNEMKGALSSPEQVMEEVIVSSLFPQSPYGVNSGGDPAEIVEHSYDEFIAFYKKYYHPSNSYIYLYGNMDIAERLEYLDREYLSHYEYKQVDSEIPLQAPFKETSYVTEYYPVEDAEEEKENTYLSYNFVCGTNLNHEEFVAMQMIQYALFDTQGAPVKQRFLDEGMCKDVLSLYDNGILQPYVSIVLKNAEEKDRDRFLSIFEEEIKKAVKEGINKKSLEASLSNIRFKYLEADFDGYPRGLIYGLSSMDSWLYRDEEPLLHIESLQTFDNLKKYIETDYYEKLLAKYYLNNPHASVVVMVPKAGLASEKDEALKAKLKAYKDSLSEAE
ncbi:MAG: insulinase family protein, partial [Parasporobacterium sp.]|nr:insulinase family protein [Parasporobacterium sp.]